MLSGDDRRGLAVINRDVATRKITKTVVPVPDRQCDFQISAFFEDRSQRSTQSLMRSLFGKNVKNAAAVRLRRENSLNRNDSNTEFFQRDRSPV